MEIVFVFGVSKDKIMFFINGEWCEGVGELFQFYCFVDNVLVWEGCFVVLADVDVVFVVVCVVFVEWGCCFYLECVVMVDVYKVYFEVNKEELGDLIVKEIGKLCWESIIEVVVMIGKVDIFKVVYKDCIGEFFNEMVFGYVVMVYKLLGVMFVFGLYNFLGYLFNGYIILVLLVGNMIVFKLFEIMLGVGEFMVKVWEVAGFLVGVLNLVQGVWEIGVVVLDNVEFDGVLFIGLWGMGKFIYEKFVGWIGVQLVLEMGGNNLFVVWGVKDVEVVVWIVVNFFYIMVGQCCFCVCCLIILDDEFGQVVVDYIVDFVGCLMIGKWDDEDQFFIGLLVLVQVVCYVFKVQFDLLDVGVIVICVVELMELGEVFICLGIIDVIGVVVEDEEIFGFVIQVIWVFSFDEVIVVVNDIVYGLFFGLVLDDESLWECFWVESCVGIVNWNCLICGVVFNMFFGGFGQFGNLCLSVYYVVDYCVYFVVIQVVCEFECMVIKGIDQVCLKCWKLILMVWWDLFIIMGGFCQVIWLVYGMRVVCFYLKMLFWRDWLRCVNWCSWGLFRVCFCYRSDFLFWFCG